MKEAAKAVFAGIGGFVATLSTALTTGESFGQVDAKTWLVCIGAGLALGGGVYGIPNKSNPPAA